MAHCPECKTNNKTPSRTWKILDEPNRSGIFNERGIGIFQCARCGTTFPESIGKRRLIIIDANQYEKLSNNLKDVLEENKKLKESVEISSLKSTINDLEHEILSLQKEKRELEIKLSGYR